MVFSFDKTKADSKVVWQISKLFREGHITFLNERWLSRKGGYFFVRNSTTYRILGHGGERKEGGAWTFAQIRKSLRFDRTWPTCNRKWAYRRCLSLQSATITSRFPRTVMMMMMERKMVRMTLSSEFSTCSMFTTSSTELHNQTITVIKVIIITSLEYDW